MKQLTILLLFAVMASSMTRAADVVVRQSGSDFIGRQVAEAVTKGLTRSTVFNVVEKNSRAGGFKIRIVSVSVLKTNDAASALSIVCYAPNENSPTGYLVIDQQVMVVGSGSIEEAAKRIIDNFNSALMNPVAALIED